MPVDIDVVIERDGALFPLGEHIRTLGQRSHRWSVERLKMLRRDPGSRWNARSLSSVRSGRIAAFSSSRVKNLWCRSRASTQRHTNNTVSSTRLLSLGR
jgi:hypothetical protein